MKGSITPTAREGKHHMLTESQIESAAQLFTALSEPIRLRLIKSLMENDLTVTELIDATGARQANVSKHLSLLLRAGIVKKSKEGTFARYSVDDPFLNQICSLVCSKMERDAMAHLQALQR